MLAFALAVAAAAVTSSISPAHSTPAVHAVPSTVRVATFGRQEPAPPKPARIHGRLVDEAGAPIAQAELRLRGWPLRGGPAPAAGTAPTWQDPAPVSSQTDGSFELTFVPSPVRSLELCIAREGFATHRMSWNSLHAGQQVDLGELVLLRAATIVGHIVDAHGSLLIEGWSAIALPGALDRRASSSFSITPAPLDPTDGTFRIDDLPPGEFEVSARRIGTLTTNTVRVKTVAGETSNVELIYSGPALNELLQVVLRIQAPAAAGPADGAVWAIARNGQRFALQRTPKEPQRWSGPAQHIGPYRIVVEDPAFLPAEVEGVVPGAPAILALTGSAKLMLDVVDPETGAPITDFGLAVRYRTIDERMPPIELIPAGGRSGLERAPIAVVPGDIELVVWSKDRPKVFVPLGALPAGHARPARVELGPALMLVGRVVDSTGAPVPGAIVELTQGELHGHDDPKGNSVSRGWSSGGGTQWLEIPPCDHSLVTDDMGVFRAAGLAAGRWAAYARHGPYVHGAYVVDVRPKAEVELVLPAFTEVVVTLVGFGDEDPERFTLEVEGVWPQASPFSPPAHLTSMQKSRTGETRPTIDGRFAPLRLPLGRQRFAVHAPRPMPGGSYSSIVWESGEEVTPCMQLTIDLRRDE